MLSASYQGDRMKSSSRRKERMVCWPVVEDARCAWESLTLLAHFERFEID